jgi:hypothetical protein
VAKRKAADRIGVIKLNIGYPQKRRFGQKEKKKQKKEKRVGIWKTLRVSHIPTRQTNNKLFNDYL